MRPVIVLCGGRGERLRSVVDDRPKVLAPVGSSLFLGHLLERLLREGAERIVLSTGYRAEMISEYVDAHAPWREQIVCIAEPEPLGTGGALRFALDQLGLEGEFFALNGDTWFDGSLRELAELHESRAAKATLSLVAVEDSSRFGRVEFDEETAVIEQFREKDGREGPAWINAGQYLLSSELLEEVESGRNCSLEREILPRWIGRGLYAKMYERARFLDIGTPEDYARAEQMLSDP